MRDFPGNQLLRVDFLSSFGFKACKNFDGEGGLIPPLLSVRLARLARLLDLLFEPPSVLLSDASSGLLSILLSGRSLAGLDSVRKGFGTGGDGCGASSAEVSPPFEIIDVDPGSGCDACATKSSFCPCGRIGSAPGGGASDLGSPSCLEGLGVLDVFVEFFLPCGFAALLLCSEEALAMENMEEIRLAYLFSMIWNLDSKS